MYVWFQLHLLSILGRIAVPQVRNALYFLAKSARTLTHFILLTHVTFFQGEFYLVNLFPLVTEIFSALYSALRFTFHS